MIGCAGSLLRTLRRLLWAPRKWPVSKRARMLPAAPGAIVSSASTAAVQPHDVSTDSIRRARVPRLENRKTWVTVSPCSTWPKSNTGASTCSRGPAGVAESASAFRATEGAVCAVEASGGAASTGAGIPPTVQERTTARTRAGRIPFRRDDIAGLVTPDWKMGRSPACRAAAPRSSSAPGVDPGSACAACRPESRGRAARADAAGCSS